MSASNSPSPLITLWYKPGQTLQGLIAEGKGQGGAMAFAGLFGLVQVYPASAGKEGSSIGLLLLGPLVAFAGLFFFGWLLRNFGRWFGAEAKLSDVRVALGWGLMPWAVLFGLLLIYITGSGGDARQMFPLFFAAIVYGFVVLLFALSAALRISFMKTFFCLILTILVSIFPLTLILQMVVGPTAPGP